jgi:hypothetical protein
LMASVVLPMVSVFFFIFLLFFREKDRWCSVFYSNREKDRWLVCSERKVLLAGGW